MARCADITVTPTKVVLDQTRSTTFVVTVTNALGRSFDAALNVMREGAMPAGWIKTSETRFALAADGTESIEITVIPPADATAGTYTFHLQVVDLGNPDEFYDNSETLFFEIPPHEVVVKSWWQRNRWLVLAVIGGGLVIGGAVTAAVVHKRCDRRQGTDCGSCGGKFQCDGTCSVETPPSFGQPCGPCGGRVQCDGTCSVATPSNFGQACGSCGGTIQCGGACSVATPSNFGQACGSCGGTIQCGGACSKPTPADLGKKRIIVDSTEAFSCCLIDYKKPFGRPCAAGYKYAGVKVNQLSGLGGCELVAAREPYTCGVYVRFHNNGWEPFPNNICQIVVSEERTCD